ncbi:eukaryotic translation initiation factor 3 subunit J [Obelidium mucronatum]|nr:eukaryotic translation initiation factor 3 subunit J [Obelidium mucronatum]
MSDDDWDNDEDLDIPKVVIPPVVAAGAGQWDDEDAEDNADVQDDWDASDDEAASPKPASATSSTAAAAGKSVVAPPKKKKGLKEAIAARKAEEERKLQAALEEQKRKEEEEANNTETAEERRKREEINMREADLQNARDLFGVTLDKTPAVQASFIDTMKPKNREEFEAYEKKLVEKISKHEKAAAYAQFVENLARDLCVSLGVDDIKRVSSALNVLANEKQKASKPSANKKGAKGKPVPVVAKASAGVDMTNYDDVDDDFDDFM